MTNTDTILYFLKQHRWEVIGLFCIGLAMTFCDFLNLYLLYPILTLISNQKYSTGNIIYDLISTSEDPLINISLLFIGTAFLTFLLGIVYVWYSLNLITKITTENKKRIFEKQVDIDYKYFVDNKQGDIIYRTDRAPAFIAEALTNLTKLSIDIILSISTFILLFSISVKGALLFLCAGVAYYLLTKIISQRISYMTGTERYKAGQQEHVVLNEYITGSKPIKVYDVSGYWKRQFEEIVDRYWKFWRKDGFWLQIPSLLLYFLIFFSIGFTVIIIKWFYPADVIIYLPILGTFSLAIIKLLPKLSNFGNYQMGIMSALPNLKAVKELLEDNSYTQIKNGTIFFEGKCPDILFDHVTFRHDATRSNLFEDLSLHIQAKKITAIVGASGSGKSTLVDLILRLYDVQGGAIFIDNINIKEYDIASLRKKVGFVNQETFIYNASIRDNISFGREFTDPEVIEAATLANIHEFIRQLPQQYNTVVGDRGIKISGGERQRLAIARAIIGKPELLILDEATSSLDNTSEKIVQDAINNVVKKCTTIIIAHRLSTIKDADHIYVLDKGKCIEGGTHEDLMNYHGKYWELYTGQIYWELYTGQTQKVGSK